MRSFILHVASITFQRVSRATLGEYLKLDSKRWWLHRVAAVAEVEVVAVAAALLAAAPS